MPSLERSLRAQGRVTSTGLSRAGLRADGLSFPALPGPIPASPDAAGQQPKEHAAPRCAGSPGACRTWPASRPRSGFEISGPPRTLQSCNLPDRLRPASEHIFPHMRGTPMTIPLERGNGPGSGQGPQRFLADGWSTHVIGPPFPGPRLSGSRTRQRAACPARRKLKPLAKRMRGTGCWSATDERRDDRHCRGNCGRRRGNGRRRRPLTRPVSCGSARDVRHVRDKGARCAVGRSWQDR